MKHVRKGFWPRLTSAVFAALVLSSGSAVASHEKSFRTLEDPAKVQVTPKVLVPGGTAVITYKAPKSSPHGQARTSDLSLHYGFNGWNHRTSGPGAGQENAIGNINYFFRHKMAYDSARQEYRIEVALPQDARALHFVFCRDRCGPGTWDNNNESDYNRPLVFPYLGPLLTWSEPNSADRAVTIAFEHPMAGAGWLKFWEGDQPSRLIASDAPGPMHRFRLQDLKPHTRYYYQVGVGGDYESRVYSFKTAKPLASLSALSFLVFGDAQDNGEDGIFRSVAAAMATNHSDVDFVISTGDMPWNDKPGDWWSFFDRARDLISSKVLMPALGNHDTPGTSSNANHESFNYYFAHPGQASSRSHYRFDYGPAAFFAMNSERSHELLEDGVQTTWLRGHLSKRAALKASNPEQWTFAYWHQPPFNSGNRHWRGQYQFRAPSRMFNQVLDWHFGGHEHLYQRMKPIEFSNSRGAVCGRGYGNEPGMGVGYLVVPSGGVYPNTFLLPAKSNSQERSLLAFPDVAPDVDTVPSFSGFSRVDIEGRAISIRTYGIDRAATYSLVDEISYSK